MMDEDNGATAATETEEATAPKPAFADPEDEAAGIAVDGHGLPLNHRLRAERLSDAGESEDPAGMISAELIADTEKRLAAERKATPPVSANMTVKDLERIAKREGIDISSAANNADRVALIESARSGVVAPEENA